MKLHLPLLKAVAAAAIPYCVMLIIEIMYFGKSLSFGVNWIALFLFGYFYTNFFEWGYHNRALHKWNTFLRKGHNYHHRQLRREYFRTRDPKRLLATTTNWFVFPILFLAHYLGFIALLGHNQTIAFFTGIFFHFTFTYEIAHWLTHTQTIFDPFLEKFSIWRNLVRHHRIHHNAESINYNLNYNFSPPYAGDTIFRTKK